MIVSVEFSVNFDLTGSVFEVISFGLYETTMIFNNSMRIAYETEDLGF